MRKQLSQTRRGSQAFVSSLCENLDSVQIRPTGELSSRTLASPSGLREFGLRPNPPYGRVVNATKSKVSQTRRGSQDSGNTCFVFQTNRASQEKKRALKKCPLNGGWGTTCFCNKWCLSSKHVFVVSRNRS